ncbi:MAG: IgGFc-binding protein [Labilithrix sp.]|nr:IgGFc-binding protein [Labilithrix sp.]
MKTPGRYVYVYVFVPLAGAAVALACSSTRDGFRDDSVPAFPDAGDAGPDPCTGYRCSRDLKKVLAGCTDEVVEECGPDQGCGDGRCVSACTSAELSKGSSGCSFWTMPPTAEPHHGRGSCFAAMVANTWDRPVTLGAELGAEALDTSRSIYVAKKNGADTRYERLSGPLPPGEVAIVFLSQMSLPAETFGFAACPEGVEPAFRGDPIRHGTARTRAFRLTADAPVTAYSIFPYGGAKTYVPTATLLLPVSSWSTNYLAVTTAHADRSAPRLLQIVASEDGTDVWIAPKADIADGVDVAGTARGVPKMWTLARGDVLQIVQRDDLAGSAIDSSKPVGVFGGAECANIPAEFPACDITQQQIPPLEQWGSEYVLAPHRPRVGDPAESAREQVAYSLVGAVAGTTLTWDPARPTGAPESLEAGEVATFSTDALAVVKSQDAEHPFHAAVYMTGSMFNARAGASTTGDPDFVNLAAAAQFLDRYVFFADYTYPETTLTIVRQKTERGFREVELACGGAVTGFVPVGTSGEYELAWVQLTTESRPVRMGRGACGYGRHEARSDGPFSVTVWGTGTDASYGYAGGIGSRPVNEVTAPVPR